MYQREKPHRVLEFDKKVDIAFWRLVTPRNRAEHRDPLCPPGQNRRQYLPSQLVAPVEHIPLRSPPLILTVVHQHPAKMRPVAESGAGPNAKSRCARHGRAVEAHQCEQQVVVAYSTGAGQLCVPPTMADTILWTTLSTSSVWPAQHSCCGPSKHVPTRPLGYMRSAQMRSAHCASNLQ